jgi:hypothetical protein
MITNKEMDLIKMRQFAETIREPQVEALLVTSGKCLVLDAD